MNTTSFDILFERWQKDQVSEQEMLTFFAHINNDNERVLLALDQYFAQPAGGSVSDHQRQAALVQLLEHIHNENLLGETYSPVESRFVHRVRFLRKMWFRYAAAILIIIGIGAYVFSLNQKSSPPVATTQPYPATNDVMPGTQKAILTLSSGKKIELNDAISETIHDQSLSIENNNGQLIYKNGGMVVMNTMTTSKGGQYRLTLADGTKVWLNAASSITYPTAFKENNREVSVTGEVYFEVAADKSRPFRVKTFKDEITVLGTSFNINAYPDEINMKTSLLEGSIKIGKALLQPGQAYQDGKVQQTNIEQDIAWKNGVFDFNNVTLAEAARQLSRWYDIEFVYPTELANRKFGGQMGRNFTLNEVLELINEVDMKFRLEGRKVIVTP